ncbi:hypothetical protein GOV07_00110 [Candidatus Woesearchaeota archaeon]|nr:hypothetical protein [Candidatus Woesearchaeota archaeon]
MSEVKYLVDGKQVQYEGLFDLEGLFWEIDNYFRERGYDRCEAKNYEEVYETGRQVTIELLPYKKPNYYLKVEIRVHAFFKNLKERVVEIDGVKRKLFHGRAELWFDANLYTDFEHRWENRVFFYFLRTVTDKFIKRSQTHLAEDVAIRDCWDVVDLVKSFLNMKRYSVAPRSSTYWIGS